MEFLARMVNVGDYSIKPDDLMQQLYGPGIGMIVTWHSNGQLMWFNIKVEGFIVCCRRVEFVNTWEIKTQFNDKFVKGNIPAEVVDGLIKLATKLKSKLMSHNVDFVEDVRSCFGTTPSLSEGYEIVQKLINNIH
jgi:hypothetical protein